MHNHRLLSLGFFALTLLAGCSLQPSQEEPVGSGDPVRWQAHRTQTEHLESWELNGKVGIKAPKDSGSGTLFWLQRKDYFDLRLSGPLGRGAARLTGRLGAVEMEIAGEGRFTAETPEALLEARMGWRLPVTHLYWWIRGLPAPNTPSQVQFDANGHLVSLNQDGWHLEFSGYELHPPYALPSRLRLEGYDLQVTLVIKEWQPHP